jgi:hypothetical protein
MKLDEFLEAALSDSGKISYGRLASFILLIVVLLWDSAYVGFSLVRFGTYHFELDTVLPSVTTLLGQISFITAPFGITKAGNMINPPKNPENGQTK